MYRDHMLGWSALTTIFNEPEKAAVAKLQKFVGKRQSPEEIEKNRALDKKVTSALGQTALKEPVKEWLAPGKIYLVWVENAGKRFMKRGDGFWEWGTYSNAWPMAHRSRNPRKTGRIVTVVFREATPEELSGKVTL